MQAAEKRAPADAGINAAEKALPRPDFEDIQGECDRIPAAVVDAQIQYIKIRHRSDDPLAFWTKRGYAATYNVAQAADMKRLALVDALHQRQLQRRAIAAGVVTGPWDARPSDGPYAGDYAAVPAALGTETLATAEGVAAGAAAAVDTGAWRGQAIDASTHAPDVVAGAETGTDRGDASLGFPPLCPLADAASHSYMGSIDRWPASLLTRRLCRMAYEEPNKPLMITGMIELAETQAPEGWASPLYTTSGHRAANDPDCSRAKAQQAVAASEQKWVAPANPEVARFPAHFWTVDYLKSSRFAEALFRLGDDDDGTTLRAKLKVFLSYLRNNKDDSPLYLFEDSVDRCKLSKPILSMYRVPTFFKQDVVTDVIPEGSRPPYQWLLIGPRRSGTRMHLDPRCTSAWNMSVTGRKRWVLMKPGIPANIAKGHIVMSQQEIEELGVRGNPQAVHWFTSVLPRLRKWIQQREAKREQRLRGESKPAGVSGAAANGPMLKGDGQGDGLRAWESVTAADDFGLNDKFFSVDEGEMNDNTSTSTSTSILDDGSVSAADKARALAKAKRIAWDELRDGYGFCEFIQYPGEVIYVPSGWWHAVINVDETIAYTQNFTNTANFPLVWRNMRAHNKRTTRRWLKNMDRAAKPFAALARAIDEEDGFKLSAWRPKKVVDPLAEHTDTESEEEVSDSDSSSYVSSFAETDDEE